MKNRLNRNKQLLDSSRLNASWTDLQEFIYQTNRRFFLLWLGFGMCILISAVAIIVGILR
ncbi:MAG: hypothetical protein DDT19_00080 [Syntrophomonadaceae bacterium]|nr:hypothetical protein [Bacillota bacterium]